MDPLAAVASLSVMATVVVTLFAFYGNTVASSNIRGRLDGLMSGTSVVEAGPQALRASGSAKSMFSGLAPGVMGEKLAAELERADMTLRPGEYVVMRFALGGVGAIVPVFIVPGLLAFLIAAVGALIGYNLPKFYRNRRRSSRISKLNAQLP